MFMYTLEYVDASANAKKDSCPRGIPGREQGIHQGARHPTLPDPYSRQQRPVRDHTASGYGLGAEAAPGSS